MDSESKNPTDGNGSSAGRPGPPAPPKATPSRRDLEKAIRRLNRPVVPDTPAARRAVSEHYRQAVLHADAHGATVTGVSALAVAVSFLCNPIVSTQPPWAPCRILLVVAWGLLIGAALLCIIGRGFGRASLGSELQAEIFLGAAGEEPGRESDEARRHQGAQIRLSTAYGVLIAVADGLLVAGLVCLAVAGSLSSVSVMPAQVGPAGSD